MRWTAANFGDSGALTNWRIAPSRSGGLIEPDQYIFISSSAHRDGGGAAVIAVIGGGRVVAGHQCVLIALMREVSGAAKRAWPNVQPGGSAITSVTFFAAGGIAVLEGTA